MNKKLTKLMISVLASAMIMTSLPVNMLSVQAEQKIVKSVSDNDTV